jgi:hypothetical protein
MLPDPVELSSVRSESTGAFLGASEITCSYWGAFRMLQNVTCRIVKFWSSCDLHTYLQETSRAADSALQLCGRLPKQPRPLRFTAGELVPYSHGSGSYITTRHVVLSY